VVEHFRASLLDYLNPGDLVLALVPNFAGVEDVAKIINLYFARSSCRLWSRTNTQDSVSRAAELFWRLFCSDQFRRRAGGLIFNVIRVVTARDWLIHSVPVGRFSPYILCVERA
jgi:hypothetical protein